MNRPVCPLRAHGQLLPGQQSHRAFSTDSYRVLWKGGDGLLIRLRLHGIGPETTAETSTATPLLACAIVQFLITPLVPCKPDCQIAAGSISTATLTVRIQGQQGGRKRGVFLWGTRHEQVTRHWCGGGQLQTGYISWPSDKHPCRPWVIPRSHIPPLQRQRGAKL